MEELASSRSHAVGEERSFASLYTAITLAPHSGLSRLPSQAARIYVTHRALAARFDGAQPGIFLETGTPPPFATPCLCGNQTRVNGGEFSLAIHKQQAFFFYRARAPQGFMGRRICTPYDSPPCEFFAAAMSHAAPQPLLYIYI